MPDDVPRFTSHANQPTDTAEAPAKMPTPFVVDGLTLTEGEPWEEAFNVMAYPPQGALVDMAAGVRIVNGEITYQAASVVRFLRDVILPSEEARWDALMRDKERAVDVEVLGTIMLWAAAVVADRPTGPLSSSTGGQRDEPAGSEAEPSPQDDPPAG